MSSHPRMRLAELARDEPETALWGAVLLRAVRDGDVAAWAAGTDDGCECGGRCFETVCGMAGLEPGDVLERVRR